MNEFEAASAPTLSSDEFDHIKELLHRESGIDLTEGKKSMVANRLSSRLRHYNLDSFDNYLQKLDLEQDFQERQLMVDLLTTNETYFFREQQHFDYLKDEVCQTWNKSRPLRIWSAACSSGDEPYSIAMVLSEHMGYRLWDVFATDLSHSILALARKGHYQLSHVRGLPSEYMAKYCLQGVRSQVGTFKVHKSLRDKIVFQQLNLINGIDESLGKFDVIFLRNVLIYFNRETCAALIKNLKERLHPGGLIIVSHTETLHGIVDGLELVRPSIYRRD